MKLYGAFEGQLDGEPVVVRITENIELPLVARPKEALLLTGEADVDLEGFAAVLVRSDSASPPAGALKLSPEIDYLGHGDIIRINPTAGKIHVMYRMASHHNSLLITERCNSKCLMCSQPPRDIDDSYLVEDILTAVPLMDPSTREIGITGGEPTLYFDGLLKIIRSCRDYLPETALHVLSNGRIFNYLRYAEEVAVCRHPDSMFGVPLYSAIPSRHDYVVQAKGAFEQTMRGLMNLARVGQRVELRVVIHKSTYDHLPLLAEFISRNLPFVHHVALMGLEITGFTKPNLEGLWIDPTEYQEELSSAVEILDRARIRVDIYNHQLCLLPEELHRFAVKSISDWKNIYMPECEGCSKMDDCGGFFASAEHRYSQHIKPFPAEEAAAV